MTTPTGLIARPIRFTSDIPAWQRIVEALGGALISEHPGWLVYQLGSGRLALHAASDEQPPGVTTLALETPVPLTEAVPAAAAKGVPVTLEDSDHGPAGVVRAADGTHLWFDAPTPVETGSGQARDPRLAVLQIWYGPDTSVPMSTVQGLGAQPRVVGDDGTWTDLTCAGGGLFGVHAADVVGTELAFEWTGDVETAKTLLDAAGLESRLIDETYSRTLQIADPDGVKEIWINARQTDLYGYTLVADSDSKH